MIYDKLKTAYYKIIHFPSYFMFRNRATQLGTNFEGGKHIFFHNRGKTFIGDRCFIGDNSFIEVRADDGNVRLEIGNDFWATSNLFISCLHKITIGDNVLIGNNVRIYDSNHGMNPESNLSYKLQPMQYGEVIIEDDCWIGDNAIILANAHVGKKSIIGAGSVVAGTVSSYSVAVGNPVKVIKQWNGKDKTWEKC